jgi:hypothetical protein
MSRKCGAVAHRLEQAAHNHLVDGSIPSSPTIEKSRPLASAFFYGDRLPFLLATGVLLAFIRK